MADLADGAVLVVGRDLDHDRNAAGTVAFVCDFVDLAAFEFARAAHDGALDVVVRHRNGFGGQDGSAETRVPVGIAAIARSDHDFFDDAGEDLAALGVESGLFMLDGRPFRMA